MTRIADFLGFQQHSKRVRGSLLPVVISRVNRCARLAAVLEDVGGGRCPGVGLRERVAAAMVTRGFARSVRLGRDVRPAAPVTMTQTQT